MKIAHRLSLFAVLAAGIALVGATARTRPAHADGQAPPAAQSDTPGEMPVMSPHDHHHGAMALHMKWTPPRAESAEDRARADALLATLRASIEKYKDWRVAIDEGYKPFHPEIPLDEYHFTNYARAARAHFEFDPTKPTSLLYRRTADGWELTGVMYTAPRDFTEDQLNERVPLSVARWHQHVNLCFPTQHPALADYSKFGLTGSIATAEACQAAGGRFLPQVLGWMVHIYPFESDADKIWAK